MSFIVKIAAKQGFAFVVGLALVTIIQPDTTGGAVLLIAIGIAATNVLISSVKLMFRYLLAPSGKSLMPRLWYSTSKQTISLHSSMSSLADAPDLVGFFSYSREDDDDSGGKLSKLRERIQAELRGQLGRTKRDFRLWQDKTAIAHGTLWEDEIKSAIAESVFFIPIITPTAVRSYHCKFEFDAFLAREKELGRSNLIFPILYIPVPALTDDRWRQDPLLATIGSRQYEDWQNLRHLDASSTEVALRVEKFCANICRALQQPWLSPEERQQAEIRRKAEEERRRQEERQQAEAQRIAEEERRR
jgi:TIR domain